jgi:capsular exopolysaccharide synthesis family protein
VESLKKGKVILVTSSVPGEGKTLISSNLTMIFASTGKKVLLLGADIRNPKLYDFYEELKDSNSADKGRKIFDGLTEYLHDDTINFKDIIKPLKVNDNEVDVIYSGKIPPNPSELLMSKRLKTLLAEARSKYDYVIIDSAPLLVVTDTLLISNNADQVIYVTRAGSTEEKVLQYPLGLFKDGKLKNLSFVVNGVKAVNLGYGGQYGYGYGVESKKWWQFFKKSKNKIFESLIKSFISSMN